jgi:hypothetical protein
LIREGIDFYEPCGGYAISGDPCTTNRMIAVTYNVTSPIISQQWPALAAKSRNGLYGSALRIYRGHGRWNVCNPNLHLWNLMRTPPR